MLRPLASAFVLAVAAVPALADFDRIESPHSVTGTIDRLRDAAEGAGATVFARIDHGAGAASAGMELAPAELLVFGNPQLGTPAMQDDIRAGLVLPLRVLAYADPDGQVWLTWQEPDDMFDDMGIDDDAPYVENIEGALARLTATAVAP